MNHLCFKSRSEHLNFPLYASSASVDSLKCHAPDCWPARCSLMKASRSPNDHMIPTSKCFGDSGRKNSLLGGRNLQHNQAQGGAATCHNWLRVRQEKQKTLKQKVRRGEWLEDLEYRQLRSLHLSDSVLDVLFLPRCWFYSRRKTLLSALSEYWREKIKRTLMEVEQYYCALTLY